MIEFGKVRELALLARCETWDDVAGWLDIISGDTRAPGTIGILRRLELRIGGRSRETFEIGGWLYLKEFDVFLYGAGETVSGAINAAWKSKGSRLDPRVVSRTQGMLPLR